MKEIWKSVPRYENLYEISNFGNMRSLDRHIVKSNNHKLVIKGQKIKGIKSGGYIHLVARDQGRDESFPVHRLVAELFIEKNKLQVNHKDGNKYNNNFLNLEYVNNRENITHALKLKGKKYIGVSRNKRDNKWRSYIKINGRQKFLGNYPTEEEAHQAYLNALKDHGIKNKYA